MYRYCHLMATVTIFQYEVVHREWIKSKFFRTYNNAKCLQVWNLLENGFSYRNYSVLQDVTFYRVG
jgi:hypothetical protein